MVRSTFSIFITKKYHCSPVVHMMSRLYFLSDLFAFPRVNTLKNWLSCVRIYLQFDASLFPRSVCVLPIWSDTSVSSSWSPSSLRLLTCSICSGHSLSCCSVCILGSPITILEVLFSSFCTWLPCFLAMLSPIFPCSLLLLSL